MEDDSKVATGILEELTNRNTESFFVLRPISGISQKFLGLFSMISIPS